VWYDITDSYQIGQYAAAATYTPEFIAKLGPGIKHDQRDVLASLNTDESIDIHMIAILCRGYLLQNGLAQGDRLSMANSVELRLPLVDYRLVELLVGLQKQNPMFSMAPKHVLREAARGLVPECVFTRPKRPFSPPSVSWVTELRRAYGAELATGLLVKEGILASNAAHELAKPQSRFGTGNDLFFKYLVLEFWYRGMQDTLGSAS
jgi:asparagine synthase (glutamine-hydrolysing)